MLILATALKPYVDSITKEYFTSSAEQDQAADMGANLLVSLFIVIFLLVSGYGAARLSYYYNLSIGNAGSAIAWSVLSFIFSDFYYPYYSFVLNPLSARRRNNIAI